MPDVNFYRRWPDEVHAISGRRAANDFPGRPGELPVVEHVLGLGLVHPVRLGHGENAIEVRKCRSICSQSEQLQRAAPCSLLPTDLRADVVTIAASLENKDTRRRVLRESAGEDQTGKTTTGDHKVVRVLDIAWSNERSPAEIGGCGGRKR